MERKREVGDGGELRRLQQEFEADFSQPKVIANVVTWTSGVGWSSFCFDRYTFCSQNMSFVMEVQDHSSLIIKVYKHRSVLTSISRITLTPHGSEAKLFKRALIPAPRCIRPLWASPRVLSISRANYRYEILNLSHDKPKNTTAALHFVKMKNWRFWFLAT